MIKIRLFQHWKHRNETTFRPYLQAAELFKEIGVQFVFDGPHDLTWVGPATFGDKTRPLRSVLRRNDTWTLRDLRGEHIYFDGQDSPSLIGAWEAFKESSALLMLKSSLYRDISWYREPSVHGRYFWGKSDDPEYNYSIDDVDLTRIRLSGSNWLSTVQPHWYDFRSIKKEYDVCAMFGYPAKENLEYQRRTDPFYNAHRRPCIDQLNNLPAAIKVAKLDAGVRVPVEEYYRRMIHSKIIVAPFGYGEMAPRDLEAAMVGAVLIKPDMGHIDTIPNPYIPEETYRSCRWDFSDLNDIVMDTLDHFDEYQEKFTLNFRQKYLELYNPVNLVEHMHGILSELPGFGTL